MKNIKENCIEIDWKQEIADTYFIFKSEWSDKQEILSNNKFLALVDNYNSELPSEYLLALGQEFSVYNFALYNIFEDSDNYCLVLIEEKDKKEFEQTNRKNNIEFQLLKQNKKWGTPATRIKLSKTLTFEQQPIKGYFNTFEYPISIIEESTYTSKGAFKHSEYFFVNTNDWPLKSYPTKPAFYLKISKNENLSCANFICKEENKSVIKISKTPYEMESWQEILSKEDLPVLVKPFWVKEDLLLLDKKIVWLVPSAANGNRACTKIFEANNDRKFTHGEYPEIFNTLNGNTYVLLYFIFYKWENQKLIKTRLTALEHFAGFSSFPTGENRFVYIANGILIEVDFKTNKTRKRFLKFIDIKTSIASYTDGWAVLTRFGYTDKSLDIAQFWHPKTDTWVRMSLGKIGKYGIRDIFLHEEGYTLINTGENLVLKVPNLLETLKTNTKNLFHQPEWNEVWKEESDYNYWDKLKSLLKI